MCTWPQKHLFNLQSTNLYKTGSFYCSNVSSFTEVVLIKFSSASSLSANISKLSSVATEDSFPLMLLQLLAAVWCLHR